jgi:uncharacterized membrane protein
MTDTQTTDAYARALSRALHSLSDRDRDDIVNEIRAHLDHRTAEGKLAEAVKSLGSPEACARGFIEELKLQSAFADGGGARTFGALLALASRRATATVGLFFSGVFFVAAAAFVFVAFYELIAPEAVGLWSDPANGVFVFGVVEGVDSPTLKGLLGAWMIPVSAGLAVLFLVIGQALSRLFVRLMMRQKPARAI